MAKFCIDCGKEINEAQLFCAGCGTSLNGQPKSKNGVNIASAILSGLGLGYASLVLLGAWMEGFSNLMEQGLATNEIIGASLGFILVQFALGLIGFCLALSERKIEKNGLNGAGFWMGLITFAICIVTFIIVFTSAT